MYITVVKYRIISVRKTVLLKLGTPMGCQGLRKMEMRNGGRIFWPK